MLLLIILIISEFLTFYLFRQHYKGYSKTRYYLSNVIGAILSLYMWILYFEVHSYRGPMDNPSYVWLKTNLNGTYCAVLIPRMIFIIFHFTGKLLNFYRGTSSRYLTNTGLIIWIVILLTTVSGTVKGRFNTTVEEITIPLEGLADDLEGLTIVQISDLHLSSFHRHKKYLKEVINETNRHNADILINTGDFVNYSYPEFENNDTILRKARGRLGQFAVLGNHDMGTYNTDLNAAGREYNVKMILQLLSASGYRVLVDENCVIRVGNATIGLAGVSTTGRHPDIIHGNLERAISGLDSVDLKILLSHDPNHWDLAVKGKTDIDIA